MLAGMACGVVLVLLDPVVRFPGLPVRVNFYETLLTGVMLAGYAFLLAWLVTDFWRSGTIWLLVLLTTPIITGAIFIWNQVTGAFGIASDLLIFLPVTLVLHLALVALTLIYLHLVKRLPGRRWLVFTAVPVVTLITAFFVLGRLRWSNPDALEVMQAVDVYASGAVPEDYQVEYLGIRYGTDGTAPIGLVRVYSEDGKLLCRVRLYQDRNEVACEPEED